MTPHEVNESRPLGNSVLPFMSYFRHREGEASRGIVLKKLYKVSCVCFNIDFRENDLSLHKLCKAIR